MTALRILVDLQQVNDYLKEHDLLESSCQIEIALLQANMTPGIGHAAMLVITLPDGKKVVAKTTVKLLSAAVGAMQGAIALLEDIHKPPTDKMN